MPLFGALHLSLLGLIAAASVAAAVVCRRMPAVRRPARLALGWTIVVNELAWWAYRYSHEGVHAVNLPLQLCDLTVWAAALACLTAGAGAVEFAWFAGTAGAGMALLTPDLWSPWPSYPAVYFFVAHGAIVMAAAMTAFGGFVRFREGAPWRAFGVLALYAAAVGVFNALFGSNYMYLCRKPKNASLLDSLGPWPVYLVAGAALALVLFWLLWLPVRPRATSTGSRTLPASKGPGCAPPA